MRSLQYLLILLQSLWMPCHPSQKVPRASGNGAYLLQDKTDRSKAGDQYPRRSMLSGANPGTHPSANVWQGRNQRIPNQNLQRKPLVYPGSHNFQGAPRYPIHNRRSFPRRFSSSHPHPQAVRSQVQYRSGYIPAYGVGQPQTAKQRVADTEQGYRSRSWAHSYDLNLRGNADQWGPWGSWSACSRSCDGGVRTRTRTCQSRYRPMEISLHRGNTGASRQGNCAGSPHDFQPCSTQLCSSRKSFKDQKYESRMIQCREYNSRNYLGKKYIWVPYMRASLKECRLYCMAKGHRMFVELAQQVKDGTPCGEDGTEACYHGECAKHRPKIASPETSRSANSWANRALEGQNNLLQYKQRPQVNFVRKIIEGVFNTTSSLKVGYNSIFKVPAGATDIYITEAKASRNYLALKVGGKYVINGGWQIDLSKEVKAAGTVIRYKISPGQYSTESFSAKGPVQDEIDVQLLYQEEKPHIVYNYTIKVPDVKSPVHPGVAHAPSYRAEEQDSNVSYQWRVSGITPCSAPCGGGEQEYIYRCSTLRPDGTPEVVADYLCGHSRPPKSKRMCNMPPCPSRWVALPWKPCTKTCGRGGVQLRDIRCRKMTKRNGKDTEINVPISQCNLRTRPELQRECPYRPCYREWKAEQWSECTKSCDKGMQSRVAHCVTEEGFKLSHDACDPSKKPQQTRVCNRQPCSSTWFTSDWSECSTQCGEGIQRRIVYCAGIGGSAVPDLQCHKEARPHQTQKCQVGDCKGIWLTSNWTKCSSVCGPGVQTRVVICAAVFDGKFKEVDSLDCNPEARPAVKQECSPGPCSDTLWFMTPWSKCSVECGTGIQRRSVTCLTSDGHAGRGCQLERKPSEVQRCESFNCDARKTEAASFQRGTSHVESHRALEQSYEVHSEAHETTAASQASTKAPSFLKLTTEYDNDTKTEENSSRKRTAEEGNRHEELRSIGPNHVQEIKTRPLKIETTESATQSSTTLTMTIQPTEPTTLAKTTTVARKTELVRRPRPNTSCRDQKSLHYCKVILRLQFCKFTLYRRRCCASCGKHGRS